MGLPHRWVGEFPFTKKGEQSLVNRGSRLNTCGLPEGGLDDLSPVPRTHGPGNLHGPER